jgi:hypothetical protein
VALSDPDLEARLRALRTWADDMAPAPRDLAATVRSRHRHQRRSRLKLAAAGVAVALVLLGVQLASSGALGSRQGADPATQPSGSAASSSTDPPPAVTEPIDTTNWTRYTSAQYGYTVGHPPDWVAIPASRSWGVTDAGDPSSPAHDTFRSPTDSVRVSVWQVPFDPETTDTGTHGDIAAWVEEYCETSGNAPCSGIDESAVELCLEKWDCHPGLLVPFSTDVQAFFTGGFYDPGVMTVVAVWWGESASAVAPYGGSQRLLEAFLSTMAVWPASTPRNDRLCYGAPPPDLDCQLGG